jgi:hypothetical protein
MDFSRLSNLITKNLIWILLISAFFFIYFVPIKISSDIPVSGKVFPARKWMLFAGTNGQVMTTQIDLIAGVSNVFETREFSRGDNVRFEILPEILLKPMIKKGDTIGLIYSNETKMLLNAARNELRVQKAILKSSQSGDKKEAIALAEKELEYARIDAQSQLSTFKRNKVLFEQKVITVQEFEDQQRLLELRQAEVEIKQADLQNIVTGEKPEVIEQIKAEIEKIESELKDLENKQEMQTIISPLTGIFHNSFSSDTLMVVESMDDLIIKMPVNLKDRHRVFAGQKVKATILGMKKSFHSEVVHISNHIRVSGGKQTFILTASILTSEAELLPGVVFSGKLEADQILLRDYLMGWFSFFNRWV